MILKSKVNGVPNNKHKNFIKPAESNEKAWHKNGSYELLKGEEYEVNFPDGHEEPDWFEKANAKHKISGAKG